MTQQIANGDVFEALIAARCHLVFREDVEEFAVEIDQSLILQVEDGHRVSTFELLPMLNMESGFISCLFSKSAYP